MKLIIVLSFIVFVHINTLCQNESFQLQMDSSNYICTELLTNKNDNIVALYLDPPASNSQHLYVTDFSSSSSTIKDAFRFSFSNSPLLFRSLIRNRFSFFNNKLFIKHALGLSNSDILISLDKSTGSYWYKGIKDDPLFSLDEQTNSIVLAATTNSGNYYVKLLSLNADTGGENWSMGYRIFDPQNNLLNPSVNVLYAHLQEGYFIGGCMLELGGASDNCLPYILKIGQDGSQLGCKSFDKHLFFQEIYAGQDGMYLLCKTDEKFPFSETDENLILIKLGFDLSIIWSKVFYAEEFEYNHASLGISDDGTLTLGYSTFGYFPTILAKLDANGEVLWHRGYPLPQPEIDPLSGGGLLMLSRTFYSVDSVLNVISKTDTLGNLEGCETFETCLESADFEITTDTFSVELIDPSWDTLEINDLVMDTVQFTYSDFCEYPSPPTPDFFISDTICINDSVTITGLGNGHAHGTLWHLTGNNLDSVWNDSLSFRYRFLTIGDYNLTQHIWYLGCKYSFESRVHVLPPIEASIDTDGALCMPPSTLFVHSNRSLKSYVWSDGQTNDTLSAIQDGLYSVSVSDGYCSFEDSINIKFVNSLLNGSLPIVLPADTTICNVDLPYSLLPQSEFSDEFYLNNELQEMPIPIYDTGIYKIDILFKDCPFSALFELKTENCSPAIYFPNIFSPNGDGINDEFYPQGINYIPERLQVFDRWGGLVFDATGTNVIWNGEHLPVGMYVYLFEYIESNTGRKGKKHGSVLIVR